MHKMLAMAKSSRYAREFMGFQVKIYTESIDDSMFYRSIYRLLIAKEEKKDHLTAQGRLLSLRWRPKFHKVYLHEGVEGGGTVREHTFYNHFTSLGNSQYPPKV